MNYLLRPLFALLALVLLGSVPAMASEFTVDNFFIAPTKCYVEVRETDITGGWNAFEVFYRTMYYKGATPSIVSIRCERDSSMSKDYNCHPTRYNENLYTFGNPNGKVMIIPGDPNVAVHICPDLPAIMGMGYTPNTPMRETD